MAIIKPFKAIRPVKEYAKQVISLPYDVMNRQEAADMAKNNPRSFLRISRSEIDLPDQPDDYHVSVYEKAKENLEMFVSNGTMFREEKPGLYIYRLIKDGRAQTGIVACVSIDEYEQDIIKKHELTRVEKELDRINHFDICNAHTEPVFLTYREDKRISAITEGFAASSTPEYEFTLDDGVTHILWHISDEDTINSICKLFKEAPYLYIADGHHRSASSYKVGAKRKQANSEFTGDEEFNFFLAVVFPDSELKIFDYNRVVKDLNGNTAEDFIEKIKKAGFAVEEKGKEIYRPEKKHVLGMFLEGKWYKLTIDESIIPNDAVESLDVSILQNNLLNPILNIDDPRTNKRIEFVGGIRGPLELERRVNSDMKVAFAIYPVSMDDLLKTADQGKIMPPKSTWFEPKLGSGLFVHEF